MQLRNRHLFMILVTITMILSACNKKVIYPSKRQYVLQYVVSFNESGEIGSITSVSESDVISINIKTISRFEYFEFNSENASESAEIEIFKGSELVYRGYARSTTDYRYPPSWSRYDLEDDFGSVFFSFDENAIKDWSEFRLLTLRIGGATSSNKFSGLYKVTYY
jgi:hypothetical protein